MVTHLIGLSFNKRPILFRCLNLKLVQISQKLPPLFCLLVRYSAHVAAHDITSCTNISCIIEPDIGGNLAEKPPPRMREIYFTRDLSISGNFKQLWFLWHKSPPPPRIREFFYTGSIHFRQFWATLVFVAEKPPMREIFLHWMYPFQAISSNFGLCGRKSPMPRNEGNIFYTGCIHFRQFWATLVFGAEKPPPPHEEILFTLDVSISGNFEQLWFLWQKSPPSPNEGNFFHWIYPFQAILSNSGFGGRKAPPPGWGRLFTLDLSISGNFEQLWFLWQKSPPPDEGKFVYTGCIHFRHFWATLVFVAEKSPPPNEGNLFTLDVSVSGNFEQLWILWQKRPPPPQDEGKICLHWMYPFQAILSNFGFCGRKARPPGWGKRFLH